jgi:hypothetical protein
MQPLLILLKAVDPVPADKDVTAGYAALAVFIGLAVAVAVLGWSLTRHLRRARDNADKGVFGAAEPGDQRS